jgi:choline dehydrogenase
MLRAMDLVYQLAAQRPLRDVLGEELNPGDTVTSRADRTTWLRATCEHIYHPTSTCRIGPPDDGVVASDLRVHGVAGLRVADASVMPRITRGNTNAATYMIAERCAELMLSTHTAGAAHRETART